MFIQELKNSKKNYGYYIGTFVFEMIIAWWL